MSDYKYTINSTGESSVKYGNCEVCGKHATEVFSQTEERKYSNPIIMGDGYTSYNCHSYFGHKECLESKRR